MSRYLWALPLAGMICAATQASVIGAFSHCEDSPLDVKPTIGTIIEDQVSDNGFKFGDRIDLSAIDWPSVRPHHAVRANRNKFSDLHFDVVLDWDCIQDLQVGDVAGFAPSNAVKDGFHFAGSPATVDPASVPEPAALLLFGGALLLLRRS
jgi:hypothetical protein